VPVIDHFTVGSLNGVYLSLICVISVVMHKYLLESVMYRSRNKENLGFGLLSLKMLKLEHGKVQVGYSLYFRKIDLEKKLSP
jgi:hypothetical protein